jgi:hypothetical protein
LFQNDFTGKAFNEQWRRRGVGEVGDGPGPRVPHTCTCIGIALSPYIVAVVCLIHVHFSETDNNKKEIEKVFDKSQQRVNDNFLNAFHTMLLLTVD